MYAYAKQEQKLITKNTIKKKNEKIDTLPNVTGIRDPAKMQLEVLSGVSFDDVCIHYNYGKPVQLQALLYAQDTIQMQHGLTINTIVCINNKHDLICEGTIIVADEDSPNYTIVRSDTGKTITIDKSFVTLKESEKIEVSNVNIVLDYNIGDYMAQFGDFRMQLIYFEGIDTQAIKNFNAILILAKNVDNIIEKLSRMKTDQYPQAIAHIESKLGCIQIIPGGLCSELKMIRELLTAGHKALEKALQMEPEIWFYIIRIGFDHGKSLYRTWNECIPDAIAGFRGKNNPEELLKYAEFVFMVRNRPFTVDNLICFYCALIIEGNPIGFIRRHIAWLFKPEDQKEANSKIIEMEESL